MGGCESRSVEHHLHFFLHMSESGTFACCEQPSHVFDLFARFAPASILIFSINFVAGSLQLMSMNCCGRLVCFCDWKVHMHILLFFFVTWAFMSLTEMSCPSPLHSNAHTHTYFHSIACSGLLFVHAFLTSSGLAPLLCCRLALLHVCRNAVT